MSITEEPGSGDDGICRSRKDLNPLQGANRGCGRVPVQMEMNPSAVLLCVLVNQVMGENKDLSPAKIFWRKKSIRENDDLDLTCSTFGKNKSGNIYYYLLRDGAVVRRAESRQQQVDLTFRLSRVAVNYSGVYSCCFSTHAHEPSAVTERGTNAVEIQVIASFLPADISVVGPSTVNEGDEVEFKCSVSYALHTLDKCQLIQSYLMMEETVLQVKAFDVSLSEASFTIKGVVGRDSGPYSCLLLPSMCIQEQHPHRNCQVFLEVKEPLMHRVMVIAGLTILLLLLVLQWCWILYKGLRVWNKPRSANESADVLEQPEVEKNDEDSFYSEAEEEHDFSSRRPNVDPDADYISLPCEDLYSSPGEKCSPGLKMSSSWDNEPPERPACAVYASSVRNHKHQPGGPSEPNA